MIVQAFLFSISLTILLTTLPPESSAQAGTKLLPCTNAQILKSDKATLAHCECSKGDQKCSTQCPVSPAPVGSPCPPNLLTQLHLNDCAHHCLADTNHVCSSCGVWFHSLCTCLQTGTCVQQYPNPAPGAAYWVKTPGGDLATVTVPVADILALEAEHPKLAEEGWDFGQSSALAVSNPATQALVINSVHSITHNQIHMHLCPLNRDMQRLLTQLVTPKTPLSQFKSRQPVRLTPQFGGQLMYCQAAQSKNQPIPGRIMSENIKAVRDDKSLCDYEVGAAVMRDSNGITWGCVTADHLSTEYKRFCA
ncbi:hypothetical protein ASPACDRAFT_63758 [Aspergillus aculeatus ATCC 16872]|uniref:CDP-diacylglycerol diphosphatase n=1 Tax=Aspergillus aculeatus (strain ATCC 16872 / CBS 172.66 / WB 5094) TaxID=690307 RepID=A0A1L9WJH6_ASPA1|nr:uncharacterized protein ASPACDRAFT_63758 [Aspergillus aculeatus ATCC 16872]OJJ96313.1 hypothetical protein ASPACDRAFT_63758 [Aspergillus aculeatus ATCC 16872]